MFYKERAETTELQILRSLNNRMQLSDTDKQYYNYLQKGYHGEQQFDSLTKVLQCECLILNDLFLKTNGSTIFVGV